MPRIGTFVYCEDTELIDGKMHAINPLLNLSPPFVPGTYSFAVLFGILDVDFEVDHILNFRFYDSQNELVMDSGEINLQSRGHNTTLPRDWWGYMFNFNMRNLPLRHEGVYRSELFVDGEKIGDFPIYVRGTEKL